MKYSYEFKKECVQLYREGKWPDTPEGAKEKNFHDSIRTWFKLEELHGPEILKHGNNINWTADEKLEMISKVLAGNSIKSIAIENGINDGQLYSWVNKYKNYGYNGLVNKKKGRKSKNTFLPALLLLIVKSSYFKVFLTVSTCWTNLWSFVCFD
uniref:helix-turn-helix domain-containing protein n=1 Tax=Anaerococcus urinomassiliensis TaxID=1745712 RepID=UPI0011610828|nr:helix-turn-helix domain-containing protein [Anaerococcus urinomassiliensis]